MERKIEDAIDANERERKVFRQRMGDIIEEMIATQHSALCMDDPHDRRVMAEWIAGTLLR